MKIASNVAISKTFQNFDYILTPQISKNAFSYRASYFTRLHYVRNPDFRRPRNRIYVSYRPTPILRVEVDFRHRSPRALLSPAISDFIARTRSDYALVKYIYASGHRALAVTPFHGRFKYINIARRARTSSRRASNCERLYSSARLGFLFGESRSARILFRLKSSSEARFYIVL